MKLNPPPRRGRAPCGWALRTRGFFPATSCCGSKTNRRAVYNSALAEAKARGWDDAILQNENGELTETCVANLALEMDGALLTPSAECGLLPGVLRAEMLARGELREAKLTPQDLRRADAVFRLNALRGLEKAELAE